jgi:hypothetical protein
MSKQVTPLYTPTVMPLRWPIKSDKGEELKELTLNLIDNGDRNNVLEGEPEDRQVYAEFARLSCGLSADEVKRLKKPDWNKLQLLLADLVVKGSDHFLKDSGVKFEKDSPVLLKPIIGDDGRTISKVDLEVPSVATTDLMLKQEDATARTNFITMSCTKLSATELGQLSCPDWNYLQGRLSDFLNESADFCQ